MTVGSEAMVAAASNVYLGYASGSFGVVSMDGGYLSPFTTYIGYQGNSLQFTVTGVPEPFTWALISLAGILLGIRFRKTWAAKNI